jgi:hypothetical protein
VAAPPPSTTDHPTRDVKERQQMSDTAISAPPPRPCADRRCRRPKPFNVTTGTIDTGHIIGENLSCAFHLAETVARTALAAQPVMVVDLRAPKAGAATRWVKDHQFRSATSGSAA